MEWHSVICYYDKASILIKLIFSILVPYGSEPFGDESYSITLLKLCYNATVLFGMFSKFLK